MEHPTTKKRVVLLDDCHALYLRNVAQEDELRVIFQIYNAQEHELMNFATMLLTINPLHAKPITVVTESGAAKNIINEELGFIPKTNDYDTTNTIPRSFIHAITKNGLSPQEKDKIICKNRQKFQNLPSACFNLPNGVRWIIGDRQRNNIDLYLMFTVHKKWKNIQKAIVCNKKLPKEEAKQTIACVLNYIEYLNSAFMKHDISPEYKEYYKHLKIIFDYVLEKPGIRPTDHISRLHEYLCTSGEQTLNDVFNDNLVSFIAFKFDVELLLYFNAFNHDSTLNCMVFIAGGMHNHYLKNSLAQAGYVVVKQNGINACDYDLLDACLLKQKKLSEWLNLMQQRLPTLSIDELCTFVTQGTLIPEGTSNNPPYNPLTPLMNVAVGIILDQRHSSLKKLY